MLVLCFHALLLYVVTCVSSSSIYLSNAISRLPNAGTQCQEIDFDAVYLIENGTIWQRRCHTCVCIDGETVCWGPQCQLEYELSFEYTCTQWSDDECCCEHVGCVIEGRHIDLDDWYDSPDYPCVTCQCSVGGSQLCKLSEDCQTDGVDPDEEYIH